MRRITEISNKFIIVVLLSVHGGGFKAIEEVIGNNNFICEGGVIGVMPTPT